jgi:hypothetical protein
VEAVVIMPRKDLSRLLASEIVLAKRITKAREETLKKAFDEEMPRGLADLFTKPLGWPYKFTELPLDENAPRLLFPWAARRRSARISPRRWECRMCRRRQTTD